METVQACPGCGNSPAHGCRCPSLPEIERLRQERDKLQAFKDWVHAYLDRHGVPHHPPGPHGAEGCRIGDRMDWLMNRLRTSDAVCEKASEQSDELGGLVLNWIVARRG